MNSKIDKLIESGKLTGVEAGKIHILNLVQLHREILDRANGIYKRSKVINESEKQKLRDALDNVGDIDMYFKYRTWSNYLMNVPANIRAYLKEAELALYKLMNMIQLVQRAEDEYKRVDSETKFITEEEYSEMKRKWKEQLIETTTSVEDVVTSTVAHCVSLYEQGIDTELTDCIDEAVKSPLKRNVEGFENNLEMLSDSYLYRTYSERGLSLAEFKEDFNDIYKAVVKMLSKVKGLEDIEEITDFTDREAIKYRDLIGGDVADYKDFYENSNVPDAMHYIIVSGKTDDITYKLYKKHRETGIEELKGALAETLLKEREMIEELISLFVNAIKEAYVMREVVALSAETFALPEANELAWFDDEKIEEWTEMLNKQFKEVREGIKRAGLVDGEMEESELKKELAEVFEYVSAEDMSLKPENIKKARVKFKDMDIFKTNMLEASTIIRGGAINE